MAAILISGLCPHPASAKTVAKMAAAKEKKHEIIRDWHVDLGLSVGEIGEFNNAFPFSFGIRVNASWKWIGAELRLDLLPFTFYDSNGQEVTGPSTLVFGEGIRFNIPSDTWVSAYVEFLSQQVLAGHDKRSFFNAIGPLLGFLFQKKNNVCGFFMEFGISFPLDLPKDNYILSGSSRILWSIAIGLNIRFR